MKAGQKRKRANLNSVIIGGGLAGTEAAWQLAKRGVRVTLFEMRPRRSSSAHSTSNLAELVCSNSLGADQPTSPAGILKQELRRLDSLIIRCAETTRVPAGKALAVDRNLFSEMITNEIAAHPNIELVRAEVSEIPEEPSIIAAGPLMSGGIVERLREIVGEDCLSFFDAASPIVTLDSVDMNIAYNASRYGAGNDYINCPVEREDYLAFHSQLTAAERVPTGEIDAPPGGTIPDKERFFEGCLPIEIMADRGVDTLRFGPMRPVGLENPSTGREPYAVVQLRRDNLDGNLYNMVGFQTNLRWPEQKRVLRMIPALARAEFVRYGVMHRNSFVCAPRVLDPCLRPGRDGKPFRRDLFLAGQITGVEGYVESAATGLVAALNLFSITRNEEPPEWPAETAIGALLRYLRTAEAGSFQPMNVNLGIFPKIDTATSGGKKMKTGKPQRSLLYAERSKEFLERFLAHYSLLDKK
ncbi:MAG: methylenetetrahydrofolate--tRNA-(uracil(54)-C(5))-methyltransferase (FADH(2)-oxidizing) TrmFO [Synergistaceae bacterium]|jgi:methylenetetrahydrofolate--tRNA-(uracil-5-)-methyltransferase|nr:methylenetetrahydrofolate--tRNA-(uracil(54)-C(5))-methyltransferase (FADH(2)-oxidizing) TrmFO [Synergistaceae bacterium]